MFLMIVVLMIVLAYWVSQQLLGHLDKNMPGFGKTGYKTEIRNEINAPEGHFDPFNLSYPASSS